MKNRNKYTLYKNGASARLHNRRITVLKTKDDKAYHLMFQTVDPLADKPACIHRSFRGKVRETIINLSEEAMDELVRTYIHYKEYRELERRAKEEDPVYVFCKENNIECTWDYDRIGYWNEILLDGQLVMQLSRGITVEQFLTVIRTLKNNFYADTFFGDDFALNLPNDDISKELFMAFFERHKHIFDESV